MLARLLLLLAFAAGPATAERFDVALAGRVMGWIDYAPGHLSSQLDNTPLGVGDGVFDARMSAAGRYESVGTSGGERRRIRVRFDGGTVQEVTIDPGSEATDLSVPANVPADVLDLVTGFGRIARATDCPRPFRLYDGRRVVAVSTTDRTMTEATLVCEIAYRVVAGPGHLSPFGFRDIAMRATYAVSQGKVTSLREIAIAAGPFTLRLIRRS